VPDVSSVAPRWCARFVVLDVHKNSRVAGLLPPSGGAPDVKRLENTERAVRRSSSARWPEGLAVAYEARELMSYLGLTPSEYSSGDQQHRGHITMVRQRARPAATHRGRLAPPPPPRRARLGPACRPTSRCAPGAPGSACTTVTAARPPGASARLSRPSPSLASSRVLWAAMTHQPLRDEQETAAA